MLKRIGMVLRALLNRRDAEAELDEELRDHLERETELYIARGMPPVEARRRARLALGGVEATKETYRDGRGTRGFEDFMSDARYAARALWHDKPLAIAGVVTLAFGIGATTAVFSAVNAVMLRDLPFAESSRLVELWEENVARGWYKNVVAPANYIDWSERTRTFAGIAAYTDYGSNVTLLGQGEPRILIANYATGNFLKVLGVTPALGRGFDDRDTWDDGQRPMLITHKLWRTQFGGDSSVIGRKISFGGRLPWEVVGVLPENFTMPAVPSDVWMPTLFDRTARTAVSFRRAHWIRVIGRLKPGVSLEQAAADYQTVVKALQTEYPQTNARMGGGMTPLREWIVGDTKRPLMILLSAAVVLLLIACANVGNLLLVHAAARSREVSLRFVLGASRGRVARQAMTESLMLSLFGGICGLALGWAGARALIAMQPAGLLPVTEIALDYRVLGFTMLLTTVSGAVFGLAPALMATNQSPVEALNAGGRSITGGARRWGRQLVVAEVALAALLVVGAGLLVRSYRNVAQVPTGFDPNGLLTARIGIPASRYDSATRVLAFYHNLMDRLAAQPGVVGVAAVRQLPVTEVSWSSSLGIKGKPIMAEGSDVLHREVAGDYFKVMRVPLIKGRSFGTEDRFGGSLAVVVNQSFVRQYFPGEDPIGKEITFDRVPDSTSQWRTIVGVVGDEHQASLVSAPRPEIFASFEQEPNRTMNLVVRVEQGRDPMAAVGGLRRSVRDLDSLLAISRIAPMTEIHGTAMSKQRFMSVLVLVFAATGVLLAIVGVFGVLAQLVQSRAREMGLRIALGAQPSEVRWLVVRNGWTLLATGIVAGLVIAIGATQVMTSLLYGVKPTDVVSYLGAAAVIAGLGTVAAVIPAIRASMANPAMTLRAD